MQANEKRSLQAFRRVQLYLDTNAPRLTGTSSTTAGGSPGSPNPSYQKQRAMLDDAVEQLTARAADQDSAAIVREGVTARIGALRTTLREQHMRPIAEIARALALSVPDITAIRLPRKTVGSQSLITAAAGMAQAAAGHAAVFVEHGRPADFLQGLTAAADALEQAVDERGQTGNQRTGVTRAVRAQVARCRNAMRLLNAVIRPMILQDPKLLGEWESARRIGEPHHSAQKPKDAEPASGTPATAPEPPAQATA